MVQKSVAPILQAAAAMDYFCLLIRRPPRSTLFPSRRSSDLREPRRFRRRESTRLSRVRPAGRRTRLRRRSEEHTSELQSLRQLVCRLLLEKKKRHYHLNHILTDDLFIRVGSHLTLFQAYALL